MSVSPSGQALCVGSFDRLRLYSWSPRKNLWEENKSKEFKYLYSITAMAWKKDGSRIAIGSLCGGVEMLESVLKRSVWKGALYRENGTMPKKHCVKKCAGDKWTGNSSSKTCCYAQTKFPQLDIVISICFLSSFE